MQDYILFCLANVCSLLDGLSVLNKVTKRSVLVVSRADTNVSYNELKNH